MSFERVFLPATRTIEETRSQELINLMVRKADIEEVNKLLDSWSSSSLSEILMTIAEIKINGFVTAMNPYFYSAYLLDVGDIEPNYYSNFTSKVDRLPDLNRPARAIDERVSSITDRYDRKK